ncbi:hypothetical protein TVAG_193670 [Trichomonas vaginalis G3]|uniref:Uncharacterized protein n=1 Tax=Trichomonas vaginalis (strain ATCC PRA-98 / G3) TaxID=412133 RepID=A2EVL8_TRIV3|nr:hypothetical protein TVAG_193670 [Trichomonas vaginalis G3]|eukprot:XP_001315520.1 hypothetical protein [Trichomonas vaginalis G3]
MSAYSSDDRIDMQKLGIDSDLAEHFSKFKLQKIQIKRKELDKKPDDQKRSFLIEKLRLSESIPYDPYLAVIKKFASSKVDPHNNQMFLIFAPFLTRFVANFAINILNCMNSDPSSNSTLIKEMPSIQDVAFKYVNMAVMTF